MIVQIIAIPPYNCYPYPTRRYGAAGKNND
jgi:hypothetical protein